MKQKKPWDALTPAELKAKAVKDPEEAITHAGRMLLEAAPRLFDRIAEKNPKLALMHCYSHLNDKQKITLTSLEPQWFATGINHETIESTELVHLIDKLHPILQKRINRIISEKI